MGCFGSNQVSKTQKLTLPPWLEDAAKANISTAQAVADRPYVPFTGTRYASPTEGMTSGWNSIAQLAGSQNPYTSDIAGAYQGGINAGPSLVSTGRVVDDVPGADGSTVGGSTQDYMNPYIQGVLDPTLRQIALQGAQDRLSLNKNATTSGAFGDARTGIAEGLQRKNQAQLTADATAKAWNDAFNAAMGLKTSDLNRNLDVAKTNAAANETALARRSTNATNLLGLDKYNTGRDLDLANANIAAGTQQQAEVQKPLDFAYQQFQDAQNYPMAMAQFLSSIINGTPSSKTQTTSEPNNSGFGAIGSVLGAMLSDRRAKENIEIVGEMKDGLPVYKYNYKGDPLKTSQIGLMAQDVEQLYPDAVPEVAGIKFVNYDRATQVARTLEGVV